MAMPRAIVLPLFFSMAQASGECASADPLLNMKQGRALMQTKQTQNHVQIAESPVDSAIPSLGKAPTAPRAISFAVTEVSTDANKKEPDQKTGIWTAEESKRYWGDRDASNAEDTACPCIKQSLHQVMKHRGYKSAADFGAGMGGYALFLKRVGVEEVHCWDGNDAVIKSSGGLCQTMDLSQLQKDIPAVDMAYSLEVGEHIPKEFEANFLDNLSNAAKKGVFMSWARPLQGGTGHFNEQPTKYIISEMEKRGFVFDNTTSMQVRKNAEKCVDFWWFHKNVMVFVKA